MVPGSNPGGPTTPNSVDKFDLFFYRISKVAPELLFHEVHKKRLMRVALELDFQPLRDFKPWQ